MDKKSAAAEIKRLRAQAKDKSIPQEARNEMLDRANAIELKFYDKAVKGGETMAKGGAVKKMAYGGTPKKEMTRQSPVVAVMVGLTDKKKPVKKMSKGGYANCGASVKAAGSKA